MKPIVAFGALLVAAAMAAGARPAAAAEPCRPAGKLNFVCGTLNSEDLVRVPGTGWIVASGMAGGATPDHGSLHIVNRHTKFWTTLFPGPRPRIRPDKAAYPGCPGPPDPAKFTAHGLNLRPGRHGVDTLYVVNHGGRESIEVFRLSTHRHVPSVAWIGCAVLPPHAWPNAVAPMPHGGFVVTKMFDPDDKNVEQKLGAGEVTGAVYEWHPKTGFTLVPGSELSGDNGIEVSRDGKYIYVAVWGGRAVARLLHGASAAYRKIVPTGFQTDNLRWAPDGKLMVTGQAGPAAAVFSCFASKAARCTQGWRMAKLDTATMTLHPVASDPGDPAFGDATVGLQVGREIFVGTFRGDRIAYFPVK
jgi:hypothetical protein